MSARAELAERKARTQLPVVKRLHQLAGEFDQAAEYYSRFKGAHNALLVDESRRASGQLRLVAVLVIEGTYKQAHGVLWIRAAWRIINAIGRSNLT